MIDRRESPCASTRPPAPRTEPALLRGCPRAVRAAGGDDITTFMANRELSVVATRSPAPRRRPHRRPGTGAHRTHGSERPAAPVLLTRWRAHRARSESTDPACRRRTTRDPSLGPRPRMRSPRPSVEDPRTRRDLVAPRSSRATRARRFATEYRERSVSGWFVDLQSGGIVESGGGAGHVVVSTRSRPPRPARRAHAPGPSSERGRAGTPRLTHRTTTELRIPFRCGARAVCSSSPPARPASRSNTQTKGCARPSQATLLVQESNRPRSTRRARGEPDAERSALLANGSRTHGCRRRVLRRPTLHDQHSGTCRLARCHVDEEDDDRGRGEPVEHPDATMRANAALSGTQVQVARASPMGEPRACERDARMHVGGESRSAFGVS